jgi:hypothetical protein
LVVGEHRQGRWQAGKERRWWKSKAVDKYRDEVPVAGERVQDLAPQPVVRVDAAVERSGAENENEARSVLDDLEQAIIESSRAQLVYIQEQPALREALDHQAHNAGRLAASRASVANESVVPFARIREGRAIPRTKTDTRREGDAADGAAELHGLAPAAEETEEVS